MTEIDRERLIIPTEIELGVAFGGMRARVMRAAERGQKPEEFGAIGYQAANRILGENPHLDAHLKELARNMAVHAPDGMPIEDIFLAGAKDLLEILAEATTYSQMPDLGGGEPTTDET